MSTGRDSPPGGAQWNARLQAHSERQQQLHPRLTCIIYLHEFALRLRVGTEQTHAEQARHLLRLATRPEIAIRIVPAAHGAHAWLRGPFTHLSFDTYEPLVLLEGENYSLILEDNEAVKAYDEVVSALDKAFSTSARTSCRF